MHFERIFLYSVLFELIALYHFMMLIAVKHTLLTVLFPRNYLQFLVQQVE